MGEEREGKKRERGRVDEKEGERIEKERGRKRALQ